ncbi:MAG TPA: hypothetical protein VFJ29_03815 [Candidatus Kapabacteria bacterium]|nr:hypothetical protein [Candidatus Kapabacteria bacterium]
MLKQWKKTFLKKLEETGNVGTACAAAGVSRSTAYKARERNVRFLKDWENAMEIAVTELEDIAREKARRDNGMLKFLLQAHKPQVYKTTVRNLIEKELMNMDYDKMTDEELEDIRDRLQNGRYLYVYEPGALEKLVNKGVARKMRQMEQERIGKRPIVHDPLQDKLGYGKDGVEPY